MRLALRPETRAEARNATDGATAPRGGRLGSSCDCGAGLSVGGGTVANVTGCVR
jgi:hypothetical protein